MAKVINPETETAGTYTFDFSDVEATNKEKAAFLIEFRRFLKIFLAMNTELSFGEDFDEIYDEVLGGVPYEDRDEVLFAELEEKLQEKIKEKIEENPIVLGKFDDNYPKKYEDIIESWFDCYGWDNKLFFKMKGLKLVIDYYEFDFDFLVKQKATIKVNSDSITRYYDTYFKTVCNPYTILKYTPYREDDYLFRSYVDDDEPHVSCIESVEIVRWWCLDDDDLVERYGEDVLIKDEDGRLTKEAVERILRLGKEQHLRYQEENKTM